VPDGLPDVAVIVPWRPGCPHRERAWAWVAGQYAVEHPGWGIVEALAAPGDWVKASAVMPQARRADARVLVVADADVWSDGIGDAVTAVLRGARWAIPHRRVHRLTITATRDVLAGSGAVTETIEAPYVGIPGGGIVVLDAAALQKVPMDPRFAGWGGEDQAWGYALQTILGPAWRGLAPLIHLWHPPQARESRRIGSTANERLRRRYAQARNRRHQMTQLLSEVTCVDRSAAQPPLHHHPSPRR
jgi:hypothetical protein